MAYPKKILIAIPPAMLEQVDFIAQCEHRTRSDLVREGLRRYIEGFRRQAGAHLTVSTFEKPAQVVPIAPQAAPPVGQPTAEHGAIVRNEAYGQWHEEGK